MSSLVRPILFAIPMILLFLSITAMAGVRAYIGPAWYYERTQEQVIRPHSSLNYLIGYQWNRFATDLELGELWQETGNETLSLTWIRRDTMLWAKYFSSDFRASNHRYFAAIGLGQTQSEVDAQVEDDSKSLRGERQFLGGSGVGAEYMFADTPFTLSPFVGIRYGRELDPKINFYGVIHFGLTF